MSAAAGGEFGAGQGQGDITSLDALEDLIFLALVIDLHVVFPLEIVLTVLLDQDGDPIPNGALDIEALFLIDFDIPPPIGAEIGEAFGLVLEGQAAIDGHISGNPQGNPLAGDIGSQQLDGSRAACRPGLHGLQAGR